MIDTIFATQILALLGLPGYSEIAILLVIGLIIFGKRLPEVGRNLGKSIIEFKKGIKGIADDIDVEAERQSNREIEQQKTADLPPAKVTPDPTASKKVEEVEPHLDD